MGWEYCRCQGPMNEWMEERMEGRMEGWMDTGLGAITDSPTLRFTQLLVARYLAKMRILIMHGQQVLSVAFRSEHARFSSPSSFWHRGVPLHVRPDQFPFGVALSSRQSPPTSPDGHSPCRCLPQFPKAGSCLPTYLPTLDVDVGDTAEGAGGLHLAALDPTSAR